VSSKSLEIIEFLVIDLFFLKRFFGVSPSQKRNKAHLTAILPLRVALELIWCFVDFCFLELIMA
jgi:hypothetical protein